MIKENQKLLNQIQVVLDGIVIILAYALSWYIRFRSGIFELDVWFLSLQEYMKWLWGIVPGFLMLYYIFKLYVPKRVLGRRLEAWRILQANIIGVMALIVVLYVTKQPNISRTMLFVFGVVDVFGEVLERNLVRIILRKIRKNGYNLKHIILVGYSNAAEEEEIKYALGESDSIHDLQIAQQKANVSLQYTVAVRNAFVQGYKELMNLQF